MVTISNKAGLMELVKLLSVIPLTLSFPGTYLLECLGSIHWPLWI